MHAEKLSKKPNLHHIPLAERTDVVRVDIIAKAGSIFERPYTGASHLLEHYLVSMMQKRIPHAQCHGETTFEHIRLSLQTTKDAMSEDIPIFFETILAQPFENATLFDHEKEIVLNELYQEESAHLDRLYDHLLELRFSGPNPYGSLPYRSEKEEISRRTLDEIASFHKTIFLEKNILVTIGAHALTKKEQCFFHDRLHAITNNIAFSETTTTPLVSFATREKKTIQENIETVYVTYSFPGPSINDSYAKKYAMQLLSAFISGTSDIGVARQLRDIGVGTPLYRIAIQEKAGWSIFVASTTDPDKVSHIENIYLSAFTKAKEGMFSKNDIEREIVKTIEAEREAWRNDHERYEWIISNIKTHQRMIPLEEIEREIQAVSPEFIQAVAKEMLNEEYMQTLLFGNISK